jgi:hypothetical protein
MALSKLPQKRSDGVEYIDHRPSLYYSKYKYRARIHLTGITAVWFCSSEEDLEKRVARNQRRFKGADLALLKKFYAWYSVTKQIKPKVCTIRVEGNAGAVFANDLNWLKQLESLGSPVDYTEVDESIPDGVKYFVKEPKYKYRFYLKSKRVSEDFPNKLREFIDKYKDTDTTIVPSTALKEWVNPVPVTSAYGSWRRRYCSSSYFIDTNQESTLTLFMLMFDGMVSRKFKLEKRPDTV